MSQNRYINLVKISQEIIKESRVPLRSSIFSKKKFNQHQLLSLIILKEEIGIDYRDFCQILRNLENLLHRIEDFNNELPLEGFEGTINRLENLFAAGDLTYVIAEMTMETPSGFAGKQLYVTFYREDSSIHKDMKRHPFALLIISQGTFKFYIPLDKNCLTGIWTLKQVEKQLEIPEWIEEKLIPESAKLREVTVGIEESYQRVIPG